MGHDVFISYSNKDKFVADAVCAALEQNKVRCWIAPRDINAGAEWGESIIEAINSSRVMVLVFSKSANDSPQIRREIERAVSKGVIIVPFRIEDVIPTKSLEYFIGAVHWLDALTPPIEQHLESLAASVRRIVSEDHPSQPEPAAQTVGEPEAAGAGIRQMDSGLPQKPGKETESAATSTKAIVSFICGLLFLFFPAALAAIVLGHISRGDIRRSDGKLKGSRMALAGLILGYIGVVLIPLLIILAIALPNMMHVSIAANEAGAKSALRSISEAAVTYKAIYGKYPPDLKSLGPEDPGKSESADAANLISAELAAGMSYGYRFTYELSPDGSNFIVKSDPLVVGGTGLRYMSVDKSGEVQFSYKPDNP